MQELHICQPVELIFFQNVLVVNINMSINVSESGGMGVEPLVKKVVIINQCE